MDRFARFVLGKFFDSVPANPEIFMELCFWKSPREALEVASGEYDASASKSTSRQKASHWSEEEEETLVRMFGQLKERQQIEEVGSNVMDELEAIFERSNKSRRQIAKKLKQMELIKVVLYIHSINNCDMQISIALISKYFCRTPKS